MSKDDKALKQILSFPPVSREKMPNFLDVEFEFIKGRAETPAHPEPNVK